VLVLLVVVLVVLPGAEYGGGVWAGVVVSVVELVWLPLASVVVVWLESVLPATGGGGVAGVVVWVEVVVSVDEL